MEYCESELLEMGCFSSRSPVSIVGLLQICILCQIQGIIDKPFQPAARSSNFFSVAVTENTVMYITFM